MPIDWTNPEFKVSSHFTVYECLWLKQWNRLANEADGLTDDIKGSIENFCVNTMDMVRNFIGFPINVHCLYRPPQYSLLVGGSATDAHTQGNAMDFDCLPNMTCDVVKAKFRPFGNDDLLERLGIRLENNGAKALWCHIDTRAVGPSGRFFVG